MSLHEHRTSFSASLLGRQKRLNNGEFQMGVLGVVLVPVNIQERGNIAHSNFPKHF